MNKTLVMDFYELTMAQTYFNEGLKDEIFYFDIIFRENPFHGGYSISGGLSEMIDYIQNFHFGEEEISYLRSLNTFQDDFLDYLKNLRFTGDLYSVPDGTVVFPNEPLVTVRCGAVMAQLLETALLACFNHGTLVTTISKRITSAAGDIPVMEFGARRARGVDSSVEASKYSFIGGCVGTSNTYAAMKYHIPALGTMAHSLVMEADNEYEAFLKYAKSNPNNCLFLVDTYDTLKSGIPNAIRVANDYLKPNGLKFKGIRIDSGDLVYLSKEARKMLDEAGYPDASICLSNGLNEYSILDLKRQGASFDSLGIGDNISAAKERIGGVYKLVAIEKNNRIIPKMKISDAAIKTTNPGFKKLYRFYDFKTHYALGDVIALNYEEISDYEYTFVHSTESWKKKKIRNYEKRELLIPIYQNGNLVYRIPSLLESKKYCQEEFEKLYPEITRINNPYEYIVDLSDDLRTLKNRMMEDISNSEEIL